MELRDDGVQDLSDKLAKLQTKTMEIFSNQCNIRHMTVVVTAQPRSRAGRLYSADRFEEAIERAPHILNILAGVSGIRFLTIAVFTREEFADEKTATRMIEQISSKLVSNSETKCPSLSI